VLNFFGHEETIACVKCLVVQQINKILIIENSNDRNEEDSITSAFSDSALVETVRSGQNLGFAGGVNFALRRMMPLGFEAFLIINNDTVPPPDLVQKLCRGADAAGFDIASPVIYRYPEKDRLWSRGNYYNVWTGFITHNPLALPGNFFYVPGCCLLIKKDIFETIGFFNEVFFMYGEDVEFCHRAVTRGFRIGIVPEACLYHKAGGAAVQNSVFYEQQINKAHLLLAQALFSKKPSQRLSFCLKIIFLFLRTCKRTVGFCNFNAFRGHGAALRWYLTQGTTKQ
jgi:hypothetical protein